MDLRWYLQRGRAMGPREIIARADHALKREIWRRRYYVTGAAPVPRYVEGPRGFVGGLGRELSAEAPVSAVLRLVKCADELLAGHWPTFAFTRDDVGPKVDWHLDAKSGKSLPADAYAFDIHAHGTEVGFDTKYVWELSRHHHTTVLAMAYWLTGDARYAEAAVAQVASWCAANPFLHGVHWTSGIELGMRLIAVVWTRRLLDAWPGVCAHFEENMDFVASIYHHQWWLERRMSSGSSANNHLIYEAAGLYIAAAAMPWFAESGNWRHRARAILEREFRAQTSPSGVNREMGTGYNGYVFEALAMCLIEGAQGGEPWSPASWELAHDILNRLADLADCRSHPPSQGDGDDAIGLLLDGPNFDRWQDLLQLATGWYGRGDWWPPVSTPNLRAWLWCHLAKPYHPATVPRLRQSAAQDVGLAVLRANSNTQDEIYCAFDAGPLGYLSIAAHGHADALAIELRYGGHPVLIDPGTFSYTAERQWREYFRSTAAHNTLELDGRSQSVSGGPFLWAQHARAILTEAGGLDEKAPIAWTHGEHCGYADLPFAGHHRRIVTLDRVRRKLEITDIVSVEKSTSVRLHFHLHPTVACALVNFTAKLQWMSDDRPYALVMDLPANMNWRPVSAETKPILGWYSPSYDVKLPTVTLVGEAQMEGVTKFNTIIQF